MYEMSTSAYMLHSVPRDALRPRRRRRATTHGPPFHIPGVVCILDNYYILVYLPPSHLDTPNPISTRL